jgi:hypothetical protein
VAHVSIYLSIAGGFELEHGTGPEAGSGVHRNTPQRGGHRHRTAARIRK